VDRRFSDPLTTPLGGAGREYICVMERFILDHDEAMLFRNRAYFIHRAGHPTVMYRDNHFRVRRDRALDPVRINAKRCGVNIHEHRTRAHLLHHIRGRTKAQRLHEHHVGAVKFVRGIGRDELASALAALAIDPIRSTKPIGLDTGRAGELWQHVRFFPLTYDRLQLIEDEPGEAASRCIKTHCLARLKEARLHFASRGVMDIDGMGYALVDQLVARNLVTSVADIYDLNLDQLRTLRWN